MLITTLSVAFPAPEVFAEVSIIQLSPLTGPVGTTVTLTGRINTENGSYKILFAGQTIKSGSAAFFNVSATFVVPNSTRGFQLVTLQDLLTGENSTAERFTIQTRHLIEAVMPSPPTQLQEGQNVTIRARVTGGNATSSVFGNITVTDPADATHFSNVTISTDESGYGETNKVYPSQFDQNPHTFYVGTYNMTLKVLNETIENSFAIGLTNATEYHRFQTVFIQAANYTTTDFLLITVTHLNETVELAPSNASGPLNIIAANWTIPADASIGSYRLDFAYAKPVGVDKPVPDTQNFTVFLKSFACEIKTLNLDNEPVKGVLVEANNITATAVSTTFTSEEGLASFYLTATNYTFIAFWNTSDAPRAQVGETAEIRLARNLTGNSVVSIVCSLVTVKISVQDEGGTPLPFVGIHLNFTYTSRLGVPITPPPVSNETDIGGLAVIRNVFAHVEYTLEARRYDQPFERTTFNLTSTGWFNLTCPTYDLVINVYDRTGAALEGARVELYEWSMGLSGMEGAETTGVTGQVTFSSSFGKYVVNVYKNNVLVNETTVLLTLQPTTLAVHCELYALTVDVAVVDYLGQAVANANVTLERAETTTFLTTGSNGVARFTQLIGGDYRIYVSIDGKPYQISTLSLREPRTIEDHNPVTLRLEGIVSIGGFIVETSHFITLVFALLVIAAFLLVFLYRRIRTPQKAE